MEVTSVGTKALLGAGLLAAGLAMAGGPASAQGDEKTELELYKQRTEALEKKVEQLERATRENVGASEEQIMHAAAGVSAA